MSEGRDETTVGPGLASEPTTAAAPPAPRSSGFGGALIGGIVGAAIVGGAGYYWLAKDQQPARMAARIQALETSSGRLDQLSAEIGQVRNDATAAIETSRAQIAESVQAVQADAAAQRTRFEASVADIGALQSRAGRLEQTTSDLPARTGAAEQRLSQIQGSVEATRAAGESALDELRARIANIDALGQKVAVVEEHLTALDTSAQEAAGLGQRVAAVEAALQSETASLNEKMATISARAAAGAGLGAALAGLKSTTDQDRTSQAELRAALDQTRASLSSEVAAARSAAEEQAKAVEARLAAEARDRERLLGLALDAMRISSSLDRGEDFGEEVTALRRLAGDDATLTAIADQLEPLADGVPTIAVLLEQLPPPPTQADAAASEAGGLAAQAGQALSGLVSVAPTGQAVGPVAGRLDKARAALQRQDLDAAIAAVEAVAETGLPAATPWLEAAKRRQAALAALARLDDHVETLATSRS